MPIPVQVKCTATNCASDRSLLRRLDPWLVACAAACFVAIAWTVSPLATGAIAPVQGDLRIDLDVPLTTSVTPGWTTGEPNVRLPNLSVPGEPRDVTSSGWRMSTNWVTGYEVRVRATTDPALRGVNSVDGKGARSSFADYTTAKACPCPWNVGEFRRGVFGYSASVTTSGGGSVTGASKWGSASNRRWRGFTRNGYPVYSTNGGTGQYSMSLHLRAMIPDGATQLEGSYRASFVVSAHPLA